MYVCTNGNKILSDLPMYETGLCKGRINHKAMVGMSLDVEYNGVIYSDVKVLDYIKCGNYKRFMIEYNGNILENGITCGGFIKGHFGEILGLVNHSYKYNIGEKVNGVIIINQGYITREKGSNMKSYKILCPECNFDSNEHYSVRENKYIEEYWVTEDSLKRGSGCPCCCSPSKIIVQGINDMYTTDYWMVELGIDEEFAKTHTSKSGVKAPCKCPDCGKEKYKVTNSIYQTKSISCTCGDGFSYPEKFMYSILRQLGVEFKTQYSPDYLKLNNSQKRSDFYIPSLNLVIETDGALGHKGGKIHGYSKVTLDECVAIDKWKDEQHLKHGVKTIRINCFESNMEYIRENILGSKLINYFNFSKIDWNKANEFAWFSNLRKEVCDYWNTKEEWKSVGDLDKVFNINLRTIIEYLKQGSKLKWCNYDPKEEMRKSGLRSSKLISKSVEIFKDGISLGIFESASEISRQSEELFRVKLLACNIRAVANGTRPHHKGFTFRYVNDDPTTDQSTNNNQNQG